MCECRHVRGPPGRAGPVGARGQAVRAARRAGHARQQCLMRHPLHAAHSGAAPRYSCCA